MQSNKDKATEGDDEQVIARCLVWIVSY